MPPPDVRAAFDRRPKLYILAFAAGVLLVVGTLQATALWRTRQQALNDGEARAANFAYVLREYLRGSFLIADTSLRQLAIHAQRVGGVSAPADAWWPILKSARAALPGSGAISVAGPDGVIRHATLPGIIGESRAGQYLFKRLSTSDIDEPVADTPYPVGDQRRFIIPIGRRIETPDGKFAGIVAASFDPEVYREFFRTVDLGANGIASVYHPAGLVMFREPPVGNPIGATAQDSPIFQAASAGSEEGIVRGPLQPGGPEYISAYRTLDAPPLIVAVSLSRDTILAPWWDRFRYAVIAFVSLTVTLASMVFALFRQTNARSRIEQELRDVQRLEAIRLRETNEELEAALDREQRARREAEEAGRLKDEFLMTLSHELRTPLTAIYGWVRMLSSGIVPYEQRDRALAAIERNALSQTRLIDDLLEVSRAISGKLRIDPKPMDVGDVVLRAIETLQPAIDGKSIQLEKRIDPAAGRIVADPDRVQQIVWNLLSNAIKFTPERGSIQVLVRRIDPSIEIVVRDSGVGIPPEFVPFVFDRFRQVDAGPRRRFGGLGLGLAIVRYLAELHGGTVSGESEGEGRGATFRVTLPARPLRQPVAPAQVLSAPPPVTPEPAARLDAVRVLVVDDDPDARELFTSILRSAGAQVLTAAAGAEALAICREQPIDVLVSDIEMPEMDGYELLQHVRKVVRADRRLVAVAVTAYARAVDRQRALAAGFDRYVAKPVEPAGLLSAIAGVAATEVQG